MCHFQHTRLLSERLQQVLGQPIIIDYKSGAGSTVGAQDVMVINPALYSKLPYGTLSESLGRDQQIYWG